MIKTKRGYQYEHERIISPTQSDYIVALESKLKEYIDADKVPFYYARDGVAAIAYHACGSYCYSFMHDGQVSIGCNMVADNREETIQRMVSHVDNYNS